MRIDVKEQHILHGMRRDANRCPVALALNDVGLERCLVGRYSFSPSMAHLEVSIELSIEVTAHIAEFDSLGTMVPFSFAVPDSVKQYIKEPNVL